MKPTLKQIEGFRVAGITVRTNNNAEASSETGKLGALWGRFFQEGIAAQVPNQVAGSAIYGVYSDYESDVNGAYTVTAGVQIDPDSNRGAEFTSAEIAGGEYLFFEGKGPNAASCD